jgi:nicotinamide riboside transporter PnuC
VTPFAGFLTFLGSTVVLLVGVVWTGHRALRFLHLPLVALTVLSLVATIAFAKRVGEDYDLAAAGAITPVHLTVAKVAAVSFLLPLVTGFLTLWKPHWRARHRAAALLTLGLILVSTATGAWMLLAAAPR